MGSAFMYAAQVKVNSLLKKRIEADLLIVSKAIVTTIPHVKSSKPLRANTTSRTLSYLESCIL